MTGTSGPQFKGGGRVRLRADPLTSGVVVTVLPLYGGGVTHEVHAHTLVSRPSTTSNADRVATSALAERATS